MIDWKRTKPEGSVIIAKLTKEFTLGNDKAYEVLYYQPALKYYYDAGGEEIPINAIECWDLLV